MARNPAVGVELPRVAGGRAKPLTLPEARALLAVGDPLTALWRLALDTGCREGELLGLAWNDLDLEGGFVTVTSQLQRRDGKWERTPTKAARTLARIAIGAGTVAALRAHKKRQKAERQAGWKFWGHAFLRPDGDPWHAADLLRAFHAACDAAGIERRRFHDLRHSSASLMRELGVAEEVRMSRMGHSTREMAQRYSHAREGSDRGASDALGEALR